MTDPTTDGQPLNAIEEQCQLLFPNGKIYASLRALYFDVDEYAVRHGVRFLKDNDDCSIRCAHPNCRFRIGYEITDDAATISAGSVYRHSTVCSGGNPVPAGSEGPQEWIELTKAKEFSRLLYTNPVCFLATRIAIDTSRTNVEHNVMILSWLTATNNEGSFMFSLNRHRHTASALKDNVEFTLSVPVQGMESLVLSAGGVSGKWGISKFPRDHMGAGVGAAPVAAVPIGSSSKKRRGPRFPSGIPSLVRVPLSQSTEDSTAWPFAIQGTVAHLLCRIIHVADGTDWIDADHHVIFATVSRAYVQSAYWNTSKTTFQPSHGYPPYLTFFGSQTFGYVVPEHVPSST